MPASKLLRVALTGGIGSGKSTVCAYFTELGIPIIDTDQISRSLVIPGTLAFKSIIDHFGLEIVDSKGELKRRELGKIIFAAPKEKQWLESLLHPLIRHRILEQIDLIDEKIPYLIIDIPLLIEGGWFDIADQILVIDLPESIQIDRVMQRDGRSHNEVLQIIELQADRQTRLAVADMIIDNSSSERGLLYSEIDFAHRYFSHLALLRRSLPE